MYWYIFFQKKFLNKFRMQDAEMVWRELRQLQQRMLGDQLPSAPPPPNF
jgi:hypothetical protein